MGANDICDLCKNSLDFFDYYIFHVQHRDGPVTKHEMTERYCAECIKLLGLDKHAKWIGRI